MKNPFKKEKSLIDIRKEELAERYLEAQSEDARLEIVQEYLELDERSLEYAKLENDHKIGGKEILQNGVTILLAGATLAFECSDTLRSKVTNLWLRRR